MKLDSDFGWRLDISAKNDTSNSGSSYGYSPEEYIQRLTLQTLVSIDQRLEHIESLLEKSI